nr:hypothetical protein [Tanacetum cinerariifolium]
MINSIKNGDQPLPRVTQVSIARTSSTEQPPLKDKSTWSDQEKIIQKIDRLARSLLIQGLLNDIYSLIDSNKTAKDLWDALARHMLGYEYDEQDRKAAILDVNDAMGSMKKTVMVTSNPLALIAEKTNKITAFLAKAFNRRKFYSKPTNNNLRTSATSQSVNKKQEFVKTDNKKFEKKDDEKRKQIANQEVLYDKMSVQLVVLDKHVRDLKNTILEKDFKISELEECVRNKDPEIEKCLERLNVCENKIHKMGQLNQTVHMIMPSKDNLYIGRKGIGFENPSYFEKAKDLRPTLYDENVIGLGNSSIDCGNVKRMISYLFAISFRVLLCRLTRGNMAELGTFAGYVILLKWACLEVEWGIEWLSLRDKMTLGLGVEMGLRWVYFGAEMGHEDLASVTDDDRTPSKALKSERKEEANEEGNERRIESKDLASITDDDRTPSKALKSTATSLTFMFVLLGLSIQRIHKYDTAYLTSNQYLGLFSTGFNMAYPDLEADFPTIVYNDALTSNENVSPNQL